MKLALVLAAASTAVAAFVSAATASAPPARNGRIAFAYAGAADSFQIYSVNSAGEHVRQLTRSRRSSNLDPSYSPSGARVAFVHVWTQSDLWTMKADGTSPERLTWTKAIGEAEPAWSPDGARIAFAVESPAAKRGIWVVDSDGAHRQQLASGDAANPSWSPDGSEIAFCEAGVIWTVPASGGTPTQVTFPGTYSDGTPYTDFMPAWSPDGTRIVFASDRGDATDTADQVDLWVLNLAAASPAPSVTRLTNTPSRDERNPAWSPDGSKVVYDTTGTFHGASSTQLGIISSSGANAHFITHSCGDCAYLNVDPSWQPLS